MLGFPLSSYGESAPCLDPGEGAVNTANTPLPSTDPLTDKGAGPASPEIPLELPEADGSQPGTPSDTEEETEKNDDGSGSGGEEETVPAPTESGGQTGNQNDTGSEPELSKLEQLLAEARETGVIELTEDLVIDGNFTIDTTSSTGFFPNVSFDFPMGVEIRCHAYRIIIKDGGECILTTAIGTGQPIPTVPSITILGESRPEGLLSVEKGGKLVLDNVTVLAEGSGYAVWQEDGGYYENTSPETAAIHYGAPLLLSVVYSEGPYKLPIGTTSSQIAALLPEALRVSLLDNGRNTYTDLKVEWNLEDFEADILSGNNVTLSGVFPDVTAGKFQWFTPFTPTLDLKFYMDGPAEIVSSQWDTINNGEHLATIKFSIPADTTDYYAQYSEDGGENWITGGTPQINNEWLEKKTFRFSFSDETPRLFRAVTRGGEYAGPSQPVILPKPITSLPPDGEGNQPPPSGDDDKDDEDDIRGGDVSGNRGGAAGLMDNDRLEEEAAKPDVQPALPPLADDMAEDPSLPIDPALHGASDPGTEGNEMDGPGAAAPVSERPDAGYCSGEPGRLSPQSATGNAGGEREASALISRLFSPEKAYASGTWEALDAEEGADGSQGGPAKQDVKEDSALQGALGPARDLLAGTFACLLLFAIAFLVFNPGIRNRIFRK